MDIISSNCSIYKIAYINASLIYGRFSQKLTRSLTDELSLWAERKKVGFFKLY